MENQLQANRLRIQVLQEENAKLHKSISKLLSLAQTVGLQKPENGHPLAKPVPLWRYNDLDRWSSLKVLYKHVWPLALEWTTFGTALLS